MRTDTIKNIVGQTIKKRTPYDAKIVSQLKLILYYLMIFEVLEWKFMMTFLLKMKKYSNEPSLVSLNGYYWVVLKLMLHKLMRIIYVYLEMP